MADHTAPPPADAPLVGRERELAILHNALGAALAGRGSLVLIGGEAGIGKTALAKAALREAAERGFAVLEGHCFDLAETPPYGPFIDLFARYAPALDDPPLPNAFTIRGTVGAVASQLALFGQVRDFLAALGGRRPVALLLDDLHWADPASLDLLRAVARDLAELSTLILATYRDDELTRRHPLYALLPTLEREGRAQRLDLRRFDTAGVGALVAGRYTLPKGDALRLVDWLHTRTEGNAFFTVQLLRALEDRGTLIQAADGWILGELVTVGLPAPLRQVLDTRLARLGEEHRQRLALAAVIGQEVPLALWVAVAEVDEDALLDTIERAVEARLLTETPDGQGVRFAHALIREALYEGQLAARRRRVHRRVGEILADGRVRDADAVAFHFRRAGDDRAVDWLIRAGTQARLSYAFVTAAQRYEAALALLDNGAARRERGWLSYQLATMYLYLDPARGIATLDAVVAETGAGDRTLEALARFQRGLSHNLGGLSLTGLDDMLAGLQVLEALPESEIERIRRYLGPHYHLDADRAAVVRQLAFAMRAAEAQPLAEHLVRDADARRTYPYASGAYALGLLAATKGDLRAARRWFDDTLEAFRASGVYMGTLNFILQELEVAHLAYTPDRPEEGERLRAESQQTDALASTSGVTGMPDATALPLLMLAGEWEAAADRAWALVQSSYFLVRAAGARCLAFLGQYQGEPGPPARYVAEMLPQGPGTEPGTLRFHYALETQRLAATLALEANALPQAQDWLMAHDRWLAWAGACLGQSEGQALWARYHRQAGDLAAARGHAERALAHASEPRQPLALLAAHRLCGELANEGGQHTEAAIHLRESLALAEACAAPYERALTLLSLAELCLNTGALANAERDLAEARDLLKPLAARPALARADALAARLATTPAPSSPRTAMPFGLTAREAAVLRLVAQGLGNLDIADQLSLSRRTVEQHLRSVYDKLGVENRTAATRVAVERGLAGEMP